MRRFAAHAGVEAETGHEHELPAGEQQRPFAPPSGHTRLLVLLLQAARRAARVTLPLLRPGLFAALLFAVIVSVNEFVVSLFVSTRVTEILPVAMFTYVVNYTDPTMAALSTLFIAATFVVVFLADRFLHLSRVFQIEEQP